MLEQETLEVPAAAAAESTAKAKRESAKPSRAVEPHLLSADEVEVLYIEHRTLLLFIASRKFHIADGEAENLIQDVFLSFLQTCTRIDNVRSWLVAAMCNASRHYWRAQGRTESLPDDYANACDPKTWATAEEHAMRLTMSKVVGYMQPKCRETLRLHYAATLRAWRERFLARREEVERLYDARFCRMWEFYLAASEMAFLQQGMMVFQIQLAKRQGVVPMTRDYIMREEMRLRGIEGGSRPPLRLAGE